MQKKKSKKNNNNEKEMTLTRYVNKSLKNIKGFIFILHTSSTVWFKRADEKKKFESIVNACARF